MFFKKKGRTGDQTTSTKTATSAKPDSQNQETKSPMEFSRLGFGAASSFRALEPRIAFDAAAAETFDATVKQAPISLYAEPAVPAEMLVKPVMVAEPVAQPSPIVSDTEAHVPVVLAPAEPETTDLVAPASLIEPAPTIHAPVEIIFIDPQIGGVGELVTNIGPGREIILLDAGRDGVDQIADVLRDRTDVAAIHILSHGRDGELDLGTARLNSETMTTRYADDLSIISKALTTNGDILLYGCDVARTDVGQAFIKSLSDVTTADVAASTDDTGAAIRGGDWTLESSTGAIEARSVDAGNWDGILAALTISTTAQPTVVGSGYVGTTALWTNAGFVGSTAIDLRATVVSFTPGFPGATAPIFGTNLDNPYIQLTQQSVVTLKWEIFASGTNQTVVAFGAPNFVISDLDGISGVFRTRESVAPDLHNLLSYKLESPSNVVISAVNGDLQASGTQDQNGEPNSAVAFSWNDVSSWEITYTLHINDPLIQARFLHDGDGDFAFIAPVTTTLLSLDLDANNSTAAGTAYQTSYVENGAGVPVMDSDATITQHAALGTDLGSAKVVLTNAQTGDLFKVNGSAATSGTISGLSYTITNTAGVMTLNLIGTASVATYESVLKAITFASTSENPNTTDRHIDVSVTNATYGTSSSVALSTIHVTAVNDAPVAVNDGAVTVVPGVASTIAVLGNDTDVDGGALSVSQINGIAVPAPGNSVTLPSGTVVTRNADGTLGVVMAPGSNETETFNYTITDGNGGTATAVVTLGRDTDADGVANATDLDDDNDGITDIIEMGTSPSTYFDLTAYDPSTATGTLGVDLRLELTRDFH